MPSGHSLGGHDRAARGVADRNGPRPGFPRPERASGFGPQTKRSSDDVQPADQLRWTSGGQRLAYPRSCRCRAATHGINPHSDESPVTSSVGVLSADRLDVWSSDVGPRKPDGAAGFRCVFPRDREHEAGQPRDAANVGLSRSASSAGSQERQTEHQQHCDSERKAEASYVPITEPSKLTHTQILARRRPAGSVSLSRCAPSLRERESSQLRSTCLHRTSRSRAGAGPQRH
jgi:hypothetical protein